MDFFGDDDEGGDDLSQTIEERRNKYRWEISQQILKFILSHRDHHIQSEILIISDDPSPCEQMEDLMKKLTQVKVGTPQMLSGETLSTDGIYYPSTRVERVFDFVIDFDAIDSFATDDQKLMSPTVSVKQLYHIVNPGGYLITCQQTDDAASPELKSPHLWVGQLHPTPLISFPAVEFLGLKRRSVCCNTRAALYWGASGADTSEQAIAQLSRERDILEEVTVTQMVRRGGNYRRYGSHEAPVLKEDSRAPVLRMTSAGRDKAMRALQEHGFCIVRDVFPSQTIRKWGDAALIDLEVASERLKSRKGIDLENPVEGQVINNFHELSMREARRVDLRNGVNVKQLIAEEERKWRGAEDATPDSDEQSLEDIRMNPDLLDILERAMYELTPREMGNWGRWNFNGGGPSLTRHIPLAVGKPGAVVSLGGCVDQTIHADTAHIFSHYQLPAHYVNLFLHSVAPLTEEQEQRYGTCRTGELTEDGLLCGCCDLRIGQTVFVAGSHDLLVSDLCMNRGEEGESEIMRRLVRPHLRTGDALLFDCRVLHFGLANETLSSSSSSSQGSNQSVAMIKRPIVYVNYHHKWFNDPKNWNDNEKLFS